MNRYKKELSKHGYMLENDYPYLPFDNYGKSSVYTEAVQVTIEHDLIVLREYTSVGTLVNYINQNFELVEQDFI